MKRIISLITSIIILASLCVFSASAATASAVVSVSSPSVKPNDQFTVTVSVSADTKMGGVQGELNYDSSIVEYVHCDYAAGAGGKLNLLQRDGGGASEFKFVITFKAKAAGTSGFSFSSISIIDYNFNDLTNVTGSSSISVQADTPLSSNNYLKSLAISSGTLSPAFSKSVLNYTVNVPEEVTTMYLTPTVEDSTATAKVTGSATLKSGTNTRKVTVTAQNGATRTYTIKIIRAGNDEGEVSSSESTNTTEDQNIYIDGKPFSVVDELPAEKIPENFSATVTKLNGKEVMSVVNEAGTVTMLYLDSEEDEPQFFVYNKEDISYYLYQPITVLNQNYIYIQKPAKVEAPKGFSPRALEIDGKTYDALASDSNQDFYLVYLCNQKGEIAFYMYDSADGTMQRYISALAQTDGGKADSNADAPVIEIEDSLFGKFGLIIIIPLGLAVIALTVLLIVFLNKKENKHPAAQHSEDEQPHEEPNQPLTFGDDFLIESTDDDSEN